MLAKPVRRDEQIKLIIECRRSGLTDYEWCRQHNINVGTFYNWVKRLKKVENLTFPRESPNTAIAPRKQEVVKLDVLQTPAPVPITNDQYNNSIAINNHFMETMTPVMKVNLPCGSIEIPNGTDPTLLETSLRILGGLYAR